MLCSKLASSLKQVFANHSIAAMSRSRKLRREHQNCRTEPLEVRQMLTGDFESAVRFGSTGLDEGTAITTDDSGNVYTTGSFSGTVDFNSSTRVTNLVSAGSRDIFVTKTDSSGNLVWARRMGATESDQANGIAVDDSGNVYTTGSFGGTVDFNPGGGIANLTSAGSADIFVSKLDSAGNFVWARRMGGKIFDHASGIAVDGSGNVYTTGSFGDTADFDPGSGTASRTSGGGLDIFVSKLSSAGNYVWARGMGGALNELATGIAVDGSGNVYTTGNFVGKVDFDPSGGTTNLLSDGEEDIFVSKLSSAGNFVWARQMGGISIDQSTGIAVDGSGNVYTTGSFQGTADFDPGFGTAILASAGSMDVFVCKLNNIGDIVWAKQMGGTSDDSPAGIAVDGVGSVYTTGYFEGTADLDPGSGTQNVKSVGGRDIFISKLNSDGNFVWARSMGGPLTFDDTQGIAVDGVGNVYTTGGLFGTADFDPGLGTTNLTSAGGTDIFVSKLSPDMLYTLPNILTGELKLQRNGAMLELWLKNAFTAGQFTLVDLHEISDIRSVRITGSNNNSLTLDFAAGGSFVIDQGIHYAAGTTNSDLVQLIGVGNEGFTYQPSSVVGSGKFLTYGNEFSFTGVESTGVSKTQALLIEPQGSADVLTVAAATSFGGALGSRIAGTSGGSAIVPITVDSVRDVTIDTGLFDGALAQSNDTVTFNAGSYEARGLKNLFVRSGKGNDTLVVNSADLGLPESGGSFWFLGGAGSDRLQTTGDANWDLNDTRLTSSGGRLLIDEVERAVLTGGVSNNHINASLFTGIVTLNGGGGHDLLRGGPDSDLLIGGTGNDRIFGGAGDDVLDGQDGNDSLWGEDGHDVINGNAGFDLLWGGNDDDTISGGDADDELWGGNGNDQLNGDNGNDQLFGQAGRDTLIGGNDDDLLDGGSGNDQLSGDGGVDLYVLEGTENTEGLWLKFISATRAEFRRRPRGLVSTLERDTISMDASDEFQILALGGDDSLLVDALFTQLGQLDGGLGDDVSNAPAGWAKVSC